MKQTPLALRNARYALDCTRFGMPIVRECGFINMRRPVPLSEHRNSGFEITLASSGQARWEIIGGPTLELHGGHFCLMQPRLPHRGVWDIIEPVDLFYLVVDPEVHEAHRYLPVSSRELRVLRQRLHGGGNRVYPASSHMLGLYVQLKPLIARYAAGAEGGTVWLVPMLRLLLTQFILETADAVLVPPQPSAPLLADRIRQLILSHLDESFSVERLAAHVGLRRSHFSEVFRRQTGFSPADFVARTRCQHAATLLTSTTCSITQVAHTCGFSSSQYFARCFRKYLGKCPSDLRS